MRLRDSTVTSIWIGGDDLAHAGLSMLNGANKRIIPDTLSCYKRDMTTIIKSIQRVSPTKIVLCTQYNPFPRSSLAKTAIASQNGITEQLAKQYHVFLAPTHQYKQENRPFGVPQGTLNGR